MAASTLCALLSAMRSRPASCSWVRLIEVVEFLDQTGLNQLRDQLVAEAVDIERSLGGEMANRLAHPRRTIDVDAEVGNLPFFVDDRAAAYRDSAAASEIRRARGSPGWVTRTT